MNKKIIFFIILTLLISGVMVYYYFFYEKEIKENAIKMSEISIIVSDMNAPDKNLQVPFEISGVDVSFSKIGNTSSYGATLIKVPFNYTYKISVIPNNENNYYSSIKTFSSNSQNIQQVRFFLKRAGEIEVSSKTALALNNPLILNVKLSGENFADLIYCVKWGMHIIKVTTNNTEISIPSQYKNYDKCFLTGLSLNSTNTEYDLELSYKTIGYLDNNDFIKVVILDSDYIDGEYLSEYLDKDIGGKNKEFEFTY